MRKSGKKGRGTERDRYTVATVLCASLSPFGSVTAYYARLWGKKREKGQRKRRKGRGRRGALKHPVEEEGNKRKGKVNAQKTVRLDYRSLDTISFVTIFIKDRKEGEEGKRKGKTEKKSKVTSSIKRVRWLGGRISA